MESRYRDDLARTVRGTVLRPVLALQRGAIERNALFDDPISLRAQRDSLAAFLVGQATLAAENRQLRELLGLQERLPPSFVPAEVVRLPERGGEGQFQLTVGTNQGVTIGAPVVSAQGLVGRIVDTDANLSLGIDWMNSAFRAAVMTIDGDVYGIAMPHRAGGEPLLVIGTPRHVELERDALFVTSGHGGVFPRGIPIGVVVGLESSDDWQLYYLIRPLVAPSEMTYVLVLGEPQRTFEGRDLALSWGIRPVEPDPVVEQEFEATLSGPGVTAPPAAPPAPPSPPPGPTLLGEPVQPQD
jgi:rod shape-determining protein MreC